MRVLGLAISAFLTCLATLGQAQSPFPVVGRADPLRPIVTIDDARGWSAIGRLDTGISFCSATLIAPDLVLTAAHCVFHPETGAPFDAADLVFAAGLRNGQPVAVRSARRTIVAPAYRALDGDGLEMIGRDLALVELQRAINEPGIVPLRTGSGLRLTDRVTVISYGRDRDTHASIEEGCQVLDRAGAVRSLDCSIVPGSSGAPVMLMRGGVPQIVAVVSAVGHVANGEVALAVTLDDQLAGLLEQRVRGGRYGARAGATTFLSPANTGRETIGGARFVRP